MGVCMTCDGSLGGPFGRACCCPVERTPLPTSTKVSFDRYHELLSIEHDLDILSQMVQMSAPELWRIFENVRKHA